LLPFFGGVTISAEMVLIRASLNDFHNVPFTQEKLIAIPSLGEEVGQ